MTFDSVWQSVRERCEDRPSAAFHTPTSDRTFTVTDVRDDRIVIHYRESDVDRTLWRDQFEVLYDRLSEGGGVDLGTLPPGVEPYVSVLSLAPAYGVTDGTFAETEASAEESPFVREFERPDEDAVHDDALLLGALLERIDVDSLSSTPASDVVDLYVLLSDVQRGADGLRRTVGDDLLDRIGPSDRLHGRFGTVTRTTRERRTVKDDDVVFEALDEHSIPREWVLGVDPEKLDVVLAVTDLDAGAVYDVERQTYVQKTAVEETEKRSSLEGLRDRLRGVDSDEAEELRRELDELEERLERLVRAGD